MQSLGPLETRSCIWTPRFGDLCAQWSGQVLVYNRCFHLVTVDTWGWVIVCVGCCPVHCRCLAANLQTVQTFPRAKSSPFETNWSRISKLDVSFLIAIKTLSLPWFIPLNTTINPSVPHFCIAGGSFSRYYLIKPISVKHIFDNGYKVLSWTMVPEI